MAMTTNTLPARKVPSGYYVREDGTTILVGTVDEVTAALRSEGRYLLTRAEIEALASGVVTLRDQWWAGQAAEQQMQYDEKGRLISLREVRVPRAAPVAAPAARAEPPKPIGIGPVRTTDLTRPPRPPGFGAPKR